MTDIEKIKRSIKIYPFFEGFSNDLLFFISIETLLFRDVKAFSGVQINIIYFAGVASVLVFRSFCGRIVNRIGNVRAVRLGTLMLVITATLFTFCHNFYLTLLAQIIYINAYTFKSMSGIILANNLKSRNRFDEFVDFQNRGSLIYAAATFLISLISGVLYNISYRLCMGLCIACTVACFFLSFFLYDEPQETVDSHTVEIKPILADVQTGILLYGLIFGIITVGQANSSLFAEEVMGGMVSEKTKALLFSVMMSLGSFLRIIYNYFFPKIYHRIKNETICLSALLFALSFILILSGYFLPIGLGRIALMALGYYCFFCTRDSFDSTMRKLTLTYCEPSQYTNVFLKLIQARKTSEASLDLLASFMLSMTDYPALMMLLFALQAIYTFFAIRFVYQKTRVQ